MSKAMVNYIVDVAIAAAFIVASVTGIIFLLPESWIAISESGQPTMLGISMAMWNTLHEWSALIMIGGAVLHVVLHWRWVTMMTRRAVRPPRAAKAPARPVKAPVGTAAGGAPVTGASVATTAAAASASGTVTGPSAAARQSHAAGSYVPGRDVAVAQTSISGASAGAPADGKPGTAADRSRRTGERRVSRKTFLAGTAAACGGAALVVLLSRLGGSDPVYAESGSAEDLGAAESGSGSGNNWGNGGSDGEDLAPSDGSDSGSDSAPLDGSNGGSSDEQAVPQASEARVSVDSARCDGCGACVTSCPYGVFTIDGGIAVVVDADACRLCGRCGRMCATQAITLRA